MDKYFNTNLFIKIVANMKVHCAWASSGKKIFTQNFSFAFGFVLYHFLTLKIQGNFILTYVAKVPP